ncbi:MAG TPA: hypothetical protein VH020_05725 [Stellaceae bacterium]|jgi:hypothetical protein|nr:hypothetical protein [Stellaceae bacterium]
MALDPGKSPDYGDPPTRTANDEAATLPPNRARQAVKLGTMRYVLTISMIGAVAVLVIAWFLIAR